MPASGSASVSALFSAKAPPKRPDPDSASDDENEPPVLPKPKAKLAALPKGASALKKAKANAQAQKKRDDSDDDDDDAPAPAPAAKKPAAKKPQADKGKAVAAAAAAAPRVSAGATKAFTPALNETLLWESQVCVLQEEVRMLRQSERDLREYKARARLVAGQIDGLGTATWDKLMAESASGKRKLNLLAYPAGPESPAGSAAGGEDAEDPAPPAAKRGKGAGGKAKREKKEKAPRQARNFFISLNFSKVRAEPGMDANLVMGECNKRWAALSEEDKEPYRALERNDKKRNLREKGGADVSDDEEVPEIAGLQPAGSEEEEEAEAKPLPEPVEDDEDSE